eukprot:14039827-Alexandrium_andersonii.AAC.1
MCIRDRATGGHRGESNRRISDTTEARLRNAHHARAHTQEHAQATAHANAHTRAQSHAHISARTQRTRARTHAHALSLIHISEPTRLALI